MTRAFIALVLAGCPFDTRTLTAAGELARVACWVRGGAGRPSGV